MPLEIDERGTIAFRGGRSWLVPRMWEGGECFILGGGPSLRLAPIERLQGKRVIAVNMALNEAPWAEVLFFGDCLFYTERKHLVDEFAGLAVTTCERLTNHRRLLAVQRDMAAEGLSRDQTLVHFNRNSGACAINLARHFGVKRIVLLGFDMRKWTVEELVAKGLANESDDHEKKARLRHNYHSIYVPKFEKEELVPGGRRDQFDPYSGRDGFLITFAAIARDLAAEGIECVNATPGSAIDSLPIVQPEEVC